MGPACLQPDCKFIARGRLHEMFAVSLMTFTM
jgi:hypothetical protein